MFDENQIVQMKWSTSNIDWFESKGYMFTKFCDSFDVMAKDLQLTSKRRIIAVCDYCGCEYETSFAVLMNGRKALTKDACPHCASKKANEINKRKRANKYIGMARQICDEFGYTLLTTEDDYTDIKMNVSFICPKHGKHTMMLEALLRGCGCLKCAIEYRANKLALSSDDVKKYIESINGNILLNPEDYKNNHTANLKIQCSCGNIFVTSFASYKDGTNTCYSCSCKESVGEKRIREFLESCSINFEQEKRFDDCRDIKPLPFDFYLPNYNMIIEFDGQHHFEEIHNRTDYEKTKRHDAIKNKYCEDNNINLLRIPYWDGNKIEKILTKELNL